MFLSVGGLLFVIRCLIECVSVGFLSCLYLFLFVNVFLVLIHSNLVHRLNKESSLFGFLVEDFTLWLLIWVTILGFLIKLLLVRVEMA